MESFSRAGATRRKAGYARGEVLAAAAFLGVVVTLLYGAFSLGSCGIQSTRANLRASRILMQRAEALRLFTGSQVRDLNNQRKPLFVERHDPLSLSSNGGGGPYAAYVSAAVPAAGASPKVSRPDLRTVTVTVYWTNCNGAKPVVHAREVQTRLARNGMPKYIWGAL